jgi:dTDP-4-amino-4,6-dideoxygalactose transaminase
MPAIPVTKTFFPPLEEYRAQLERVWASGWLTNRGELVQELESKLCEHLGVSNCLFVNNGTIAIQLAIKALGLQGEVITTPFSYVATTSSLVWEGCTPVFADIDPRTLCLDPRKAEAAITPRTTAILATHVYGIPCDVAAFEDIARRHGLKIIYDAAHCFGVRHRGRSLFDFGDVSTSSFHATKIFHTGEGGGLFAGDPEVRHRLYYMHNFGHHGQEAFWGVGINAKTPELTAAMGLSVLPHMDEIVSVRRTVSERYDAELAGLPLARPELPPDTEYNYAYYPVLFESEAALLRVRDALNQREIFPRRYFYPSLNTLPYLEVRQPMPVAEDAASRVLCLPLYVGLTESEQTLIVSTIRSELRGV